MKRSLYKLIFLKLMGWKIVGSVSKDTKKCILLVVPHTSWHDFYLGVFTRGILGQKMNFVAKKELFRFPLGAYFRWMGGAPLNRAKNENKVEAIAAIFAERDEFRLAIAPEGTRKKVTTWKTGFYYIAQKAHVPVVPVAFDWGKREVRIGEPFFTTDNIDNDIASLEKFFIGVVGKIPEYSYKPKSE